MEAQWAGLQSAIEGLRAEKREVVAAVVEAEKQVCPGWRFGFFRGGRQSGRGTG